MYRRQNWLQIQRRFPTELACRKYLEKQRWGQGFRCPRCRCQRMGFHRRRGLYQCKGCRYQASLTAGTIFHKTRTPLHKWFWLVLLMSQNKHGVSMLEAQRMLGIRSYKTVWGMCHKIRTAMRHRDARYKLAGLIELDDASFGHKFRGGNRQKRGDTEKTVRVAVSTSPEGRPRFARMEVADCAGIGHAQDMARRSFAPKQVIRTDGGHSFPVLKELGYQHERHPYLTPQGMDQFLPWVHTVIANAKRFMLGTHHQESPKYLQRFLDEFAYRFNRRWVAGQLFDRLLTACVNAPCVTFAELCA